MNEARFVITLIHGTWAKRATWIQPHSMLTKALRDRLGQDIKIFRLIWSGRNSSTARSVATERLKKKLALRLKNYPTARHYIICHSHGGNIALDAVAGGDLEKKIDGIVCLATPFLLARERGFGANPAAMLAPAVVVAILLLLIAYDVVWPTLWLDFTFMSLAMLVMWVLAFFLAHLWFRFARNLRKELTSVQVSDPSRFLIIRSPADEASGALVFSQFLSWITVRIYLWLDGLFERFKAAVTWLAERKWILAVVIAVALVAFAGSLIAISDAVDPTSWLGTIATVGIVVSIVVAAEALVLLVPDYGVDWATASLRLVVASMVWPTIFLLSVFLLPFGWKIALANILLDVTAETTPVGSSWNVHLVMPEGRDYPRDEMQNIQLMHSIIYENPSVLKIIGNWIASGREDQSAAS
jgi:hypothetical protein